MDDIQVEESSFIENENNATEAENNPTETGNDTTETDDNPTETENDTTETENYPTEMEYYRSTGNITIDKICKILTPRFFSVFIASLSVCEVSYVALFVDESLKSRPFRLVGISIITFIKFSLMLDKRIGHLDYKNQDFLFLIALSLWSVITNIMDIMQKVPNHLMLSEFCGFLLILFHCLCLSLFVRRLDRQDITDVIQFNKQNIFYKKNILDNFEYLKNDHHSESYFQTYYRDLINRLRSYINLFQNVDHAIDDQAVSAASDLNNPLQEERNSRPTNTTTTTNNTQLSDLGAHAVEENDYLFHASAASAEEENYSTHVNAASTLNPPLQEERKSRPAKNNTNHHIQLANLENDSAEFKATSIEESQSNETTVHAITGARSKSATRDFSKSKTVDEENRIKNKDNEIKETDGEMSGRDSKNKSSLKPLSSILKPSTPSPCEDKPVKILDSPKFDPKIPKETIVKFNIDIEQEPHSYFHDVDPNLPRNFIEKLGAAPFKITSVRTITILKCFPGNEPGFYSAFQTREKLVLKI